MSNLTKSCIFKCAAILFLIIVNIINIRNPILEQHSFRQTQTAISIFYLIRDGFLFDYITPVLGKSYSIPFEFPIFHFLVSFIVKNFNINLDVAGRVLSLIFAIGALIANDLLLREMRINSKARLFIFILIVCSPIFLFWSGTFMIESAALFFAITSLLFAIKYYNNQLYIYLLVWILFAILALLQKVTTAVFPYFFGCIAILYSFSKGGRINFWNSIFLSLALTFPIFVGFAWVLHTDTLKSANPIAFFQLTSSALRSWNFGTFDQRLSYSFWVSNLFIRALAPTALFGVAIVAGLLCFVNEAKTKSSRWIPFLFLSLYLFPQIVFTNLFIVHDYYHYAVIIYLCNFVGIAYAQLSGCFKRLSIWLVIATCICSLIFFTREYRHAKFSHIESSYGTLAISHEIKNQIDSEDVFVLFGYDWSSEVAYYSERKSLTVPDWYLDKLDIGNLDKYFDKTPKLIVICNNTNRKYDSFVPNMADYQLVKVLQGCTLFKQRT